MGVSLIGRKCWLQEFSNKPAPAPNPNPKRWELLDKAEYSKYYVLKVRYLDATNFDGVKIMVYHGRYRHVDYLDPHFENSPSSPIARFKPNEGGWELAKAFAKALSS